MKIALVSPIPKYSKKGQLICHPITMSCTDGMLLVPHQFILVEMTKVMLVTEYSKNKWRIK